MTGGVLGDALMFNSYSASSRLGRCTERRTGWTMHSMRGSSAARTVQSLHAQVNDQRWVVEAMWLILTSNSVVATSQKASLSRRIGATHRIMLDRLAEAIRHALCDRSDAAVQKAALARGRSDTASA
jgi:hypothetical protein